MMKRRFARPAGGFVCLSVLLALAALTAGVASAGKPAATLTCTGIVSTGTWGNVVVPDGAELSAQRSGDPGQRPGWDWKRLVRGWRKHRRESLCLWRG